MPHVISPEAKEFLDIAARLLEAGGWRLSYRYGRKAHDVWTQAGDRFRVSQGGFNTKKYPASVKARFYHADPASSPGRVP